VLGQCLVLAFAVERLTERKLLGAVRADEVRSERLFHVIRQAWHQMAKADPIEYSRHGLENADSHVQSRCKRGSGMVADFQRVEASCDSGTAQQARSPS